MRFSSRKKFAPFDPPIWSLVVKPESTENRTSRLFFTRLVATSPPVRERKPEADLQLWHRKTLERAFVVSLFFLVALFQIGRIFSLQTRELQASKLTIEVADIPKTEQKQRPAYRPPLPSVPIPSLDESVPEDVTIETTDMTLDLATLPAPPPPSESENWDSESMFFIPYDEPPLPIGGMQALMERVRYPRLAVKSGLEATVVVAALISEEGRTLKTYILKDSGCQVGFEAAAQQAVMETRWKPAKQRDKAIKVWVSIPIKFQLKLVGPEVSVR